MANSSPDPPHSGCDGPWRLWISRYPGPTYRYRKFCDGLRDGRQKKWPYHLTLPSSWSCSSEWSCYTYVKTWFQFLQGITSRFCHLTWKPFWWLIRTFLCSRFLSIYLIVCFWQFQFVCFCMFLLHFYFRIPSWAHLLPTSCFLYIQIRLSSSVLLHSFFSLCVVAVSCGPAEVIPHVYFCSCPPLWLPWHMLT